MSHPAKPKPVKVRLTIVGALCNVSTSSLAEFAQRQTVYLLASEPPIRFIAYSHESIEQARQGHIDAQDGVLDAAEWQQLCMSDEAVQLDEPAEYNDFTLLWKFSDIRVVLPDDGLTEQVKDPQLVEHIASAIQWKDDCVKDLSDVGVLVRKQVLSDGTALCIVHESPRLDELRRTWSQRAYDQALDLMREWGDERYARLALRLALRADATSVALIEPDPIALIAFIYEQLGEHERGHGYITMAVETLGPTGQQAIEQATNRLRAELQLRTAAAWAVDTQTQVGGPRRPDLRSVYIGGYQTS